MIIARDIIPVTYLERRVRYVAVVELENGDVIETFLPDPGRLTELLVPGNRGWIVPAGKNAKKPRRTAHDFIAIEHGGLVVCVDTRVPNRYVHELLKENYLFPELPAGFRSIRPEYSYGKSRIDFMTTAGDGGQNYLIEVKSVTLVEDGVALFPDAPTTRGTRHVRELIHALKDDFIPVIVFVIQRDDATAFKPNEATDPEFAGALFDAENAGVTLKIFKNKTTIDENKALFSMEPSGFVKKGF